MKKIVICVILALLVMGAAISVSAVNGNFQKVILPAKDTNVSNVEKPDTDGPSAGEEEMYGYQINFSEAFFEQLQLPENGLKMYVDGKEITEMPVGGFMRGLVIEFETGLGNTAYYSLTVSPDSAYRIYEGEYSESFGITEFSCPIALILCGDIDLKSVRLR